MSGWRRAVIGAVARFVRPWAHREARFIRSIEFASREAKQRAVDERLAGVLRHAAETCPYYGRVLREAGVVDGGEVRLDRFENIPFLTKAILRREGAALHASDHERRHSYVNMSSGSTGEPVTFLQDRGYWWRRTATRFLFDRWAGKAPGDRELMLWGSQRDLLEGRQSLVGRLQGFLFNLRRLNAFRMSEADMARYVEEWNRFGPVLVWAYVDSIRALGRYVQRTGKSVVPPTAILSTAGPLTEGIREFVEGVFGCPVYNQYGAREVGAIASECSAREGLHVFENAVRVEVVRPDGAVAAPGEHGEIVVTSLINRSMPMIRYRIGDTAAAASASCSCGRSFQLLEAVTGRLTDHFRAADGALVHGGYFRQMFYGRSWVEKFQVRQKTLDRIDAYVVNVADPPPGEVAEMEAMTRAVMGEGCELNISLVEDIPPSPSGKFLHTICELPDRPDGAGRDESPENDRK
ncbi:MAG: phenylacetate--CoA ligase family protein [Planctomycetota bacterium]